MKYKNISNSLYIKGRIGWKGLKKKEYLRKGDYRIINGSNISNGKINWSDCGYITKQRYFESPEIMLQKGDILVTKDGTIGKVALVEDLVQPSTIASGLFIVRNKDTDECDTLFLYYYLQTRKFKEFIHSRTEGSVIPHLYQKDFKEFKIPDISLANQRQISSKLNYIQKKITLNNQLNDNLLELISSIWKKQSSDIHNKITLKRLAKRIITGKTPSTKIKENYGIDIPFVKIPDMHNKIFIDETSQKLSIFGANSQKNKYVPKNSIIVSCIGTPGLVSLIGRTVQTNQQINSLILDNKYIYCTYLELKSLKYKIRNLGSGGTTIQNLNKTNFGNIKITVPNKDSQLDNFNGIAKPIFERIHVNNIELQNLVKIKEVLLGQYF
ncbi:restriction endonuclease subunit S [Lactobacillus sp. W8088]|nr:restriction endonuclease subunit S [Lactobacillus sp. W8088]